MFKYLIGYPLKCLALLLCFLLLFQKNENELREQRGRSSIKNWDILDVIFLKYRCIHDPFSISFITLYRLSILCSILFFRCSDLMNSNYHIINRAYVIYMKLDLS